ncbi:MAG: acyltransferase family protein [Paraglaciecola sp.]|uniref:acyltransferase family protein n=1 Tax=Paraglaciecola sp. TaxID=1920173 RepID=UPI003299DEEA
MQFRKDINGLRAIAVIGVVLFHFDASWMPGGFAGVDVFFVISGFLMTGIIFRGLQEESFSVLRFYIARANRIIPALAFLCLMMLTVGWLFLEPFDYKTLSKHAISSIGFVSNIIYWTESGYFDSTSHSKWLLHTWSLSVEWQFYIIYPVLLLTLKRFMSIKSVKATLVLGTLLGFIFCIIVTYRWPNAAYYLLPTRAWEMMIGGIAYLYPLTIRENSKRPLEWFGVTLIAGSYYFISQETPWPGYLAFIPVLGAFIIIQAQRGDSFLTSNFVFQKLGAWSYSIYLWHWPFVVAIYYFSLNEAFIYLGLVLSLLLGFLSNKYIEKIKFKNSYESILESISCKPLHMSVVVVLLGWLGYENIRIIYNIPKDVYVGMSVDKDTDSNGEYTWARHEYLNNKSSFENEKLKVLVIGDSQAGDFINSIFEAGLGQNVDVISRIVRAKCGAFYLNKKQFKTMIENSPHSISELGFNECQKSIEMLRNDNVLAQADMIILVMNWRDEHLPSILESVANARLVNSDADIFLSGVKFFKENIPDMFYGAYKTGVTINEYAFRHRKSELIDVEYQNSVFKSSQEEVGFTYIDLSRILCNDNQCFVSNLGSQPLFYDNLHLTKAGAEYLGNEFKSREIFPSFLYLQ